MKVLNCSLVLLVSVLQSFLFNQVQAQVPGYLNDPNYLTYFNNLRHGNLLVGLPDRAGIRAKLIQYGESEKLKQFDAELQNEFKEFCS